METIADNIEILEANGTPVNYGFIRVVCSAFSPNKPGENDMWRIMQSTYPGLLLGQPLLASAEIKKATQAFRSIYESKPYSEHQTSHSCRNNLEIGRPEWLARGCQC